MLVAPWPSKKARGYLLVIKRRMSFIVKNRGRRHLNHVIQQQVNPASPVPAVVCAGAQYHLCPTFDLDRTMRKQSRLWGVLQDNWPGSLKCQSNKRPRDGRLSQRKLRRKDKKGSVGLSGTQGLLGISGKSLGKLNMDCMLDDM